jgi:hypothetical protein
MPVFTIETPRGQHIDVEADDQATAMRGAQRYDLEDYASAAAQKAGVDPALVLRQMNVESGANPSARSPKGALGPMQLMPGTAKQLGVDPSDPYQNIDGGVRYLKQQMDAFGGDTEKALAAYNAGPGAVQRAGGVPNYPETKAYVAAVNRPVVSSAAPAPQVATPHKSQALGFAKGVNTPFDNAASWLEGAVNGIGGLPGLVGLPSDPHLGADISHATGMPSAAQVKQAHAEMVAQAARRGVVPGKVGEFAGNVVGTLPTALLPGGALVQGAAGGALLSDAKNVGGVARDAAFGAAGAKLGDMAFKGVGNAVAKMVRPKAMTPAALEAAKDAAYKAVDGMGVQYKPGPFSGLVSVMGDEVKANPVYDPLSHTKVNSALAKIQSLDGQSPTFQQVENLRKFIRGNVVDAADTNAEKSVGMGMIRQVDDFLGSMTPSHVVTPDPTSSMAKFGVGRTSSDPAAAVAAVQKARDLARRDFLTKDILGAVQSAKDRAAVSGTGGNLDNTLRQEVRKVLTNNPNVKPDERAALEQAFKGDALGNVMRLVGRLSPTTGGLSAILNVGATMTNPMLGIPGLVGAGAKVAADAGTKGRIGEALRVVAGATEGKAAPMIRAGAKRLGPIAAGVGATALTTGAAAARQPVTPWPQDAVMQDAAGNFYDASGRVLR